ncbi:MAG: hypothetical protein ACI8UQ_001950 [Bacteroidia bacterium]|jgi:hypothetical protein
MKKTLLTLAVALSMGTALLTSCGSDDTTGTTPEPTKTLVRANLYDTDWFGQGNQGPTHSFNSNGVYGNTGSWEWLGDENSDSMEYKATASDVTRKLYFKYATETEMACVVGKPLNDNDYTVYKTSTW